MEYKFDYEIKSLKPKLELYFGSLKNDDSKLLNFLIDPLSDLIENGFRIFEKVKNAPYYNYYIRNLILNLKKKTSNWDKCAACKIGLKVLYHAFAIHNGLDISFVVDHIDFKNITAEFFGKSITEIFDIPIIKELFSAAISNLEKNFVYRLIEELCKFFGLCKN